jgi:capsular polysaccharide biosynthesis protein
MVPADPSRQKRTDDLRGQIAALDNQIAAKQRAEDRLKSMLGDYQGRVEATPGRESELVSLTRDYETLRQRYQNLLSKREDARIAANLERRQIGEQFRIVDAARLPERPTSPNRLRMNLLGMLAGLGLGVLLAALLEYRDASLRTDNDVVSVLALPVLAVVPLLLTDVERRARRRRRLLMSTAVVAIACVGLAAVLWQLGMWPGRM